MRSKHIKLLAGILFVFAFLSCTKVKPTKVLPVYGDKKEVNGDTTFHTIGQFNFIDQDGEKVTNELVKDRIYVANFFFATCESICPEMSKNLNKVQEAFDKNDSVLILSHSVNPKHDTVEVLKQYADLYKAKKGKWHFLTGDKKQIYDLALKSYLVNALEDDGSAEGFLHSEMLLLIDKKGRIRGMYDGTDLPAVLKLNEDIKLLKKEDPSL